MKLIELILAIGDENIRFQALDESLLSCDRGKKETRITFATDQPFDFNGTQDQGLILWLPRDKVKAALAGDRPNTKDQT